jgi:hypothetical protein
MSIFGFSDWFGERNVSDILDLKGCAASSWGDVSHHKMFKECSGGNRKAGSMSIQEHKDLVDTLNLRTNDRLTGRSPAMIGERGRWVTASLNRSENQGF